MSQRGILNFFLEAIIKLVLLAALGFFAILIAVSTMVAGFYLPWFLIGIGGLIGVLLLAFALEYWGIIYWGITFW